MWSTVGDVNFGLFTLIWDHMLGTFVNDPVRRFSSADLGIDHWPRYPTDYLGQVAQPFRSDSSLINLSDVPM